MNRIPLRINRLNSLAELPDYQSDHAAGMDLHAALSEPVTIESGEIRLIPCGFAMALPEGYEAQIRPRSGLACKHGISVPNAPGTIDADYRGEVKVILMNLGGETVNIDRGDRIAQLVIAPVTHVVIAEVDDVNETSRGEGGFGSTGVN